MANEEVLGPRKTMVVLVIVVGCFAVLWPRILSPLVLGGSRDALQPNQFDREAGCCEVLFPSEIALLEILEEVCNAAANTEGKLSPIAAAECRRTVNETCGVDIAAFLKRSENVGKTSKMLLNTMKASNSSCLKEHFGVPVISLSSHTAYNSWTFQDTLKQERTAVRMGPHPALRERGRAIPPGAPPPARPAPAPLPPHVRPPPIPGMRPPLGGAGGPVQAPKSSMGFVMPIYTICIIVFFVYTLSKIIFKRTGTVPYEHVAPDPQFRRRVFRDDSRSTPDKLVVTAISGLVAEVQQQMEASYAQNQQRQDLQDNHARPYTNGTIIHSGPVQIVASEYQETKQKSPEPKSALEQIDEPKEPNPEKEPGPEKQPIPEEPSQEKEEPNQEKSSPERDPTEELIRLSEKVEAKTDTLAKLTDEFLNVEKNRVLVTPEKQNTPDLLEEALKEDSPVQESEEEVEEEIEEEEEIEAPEKSTVKVLGMETSAESADGGAWRGPPPAPPAPPRAHEAEDVKAIYLETDIPQQSRVLVADFADRADNTHRTKHSPMVVSGKMTLSLIQDAPRDSPDRDLESTMDDFTTASGLTQPAEQKDEEDEAEEELSEDEVDEEIEEVEEIVEEEEIEEDIDEDEQEKKGKE